MQIAILHNINHYCFFFMHTAILLNINRYWHLLNANIYITQY